MFTASPNTTPDTATNTTQSDAAHDTPSLQPRVSLQPCISLTLPPLFFTHDELGTHTPPVPQRALARPSPPPRRHNYAHILPRDARSDQYAPPYLVRINTVVATCVPTIASELGAFDREAWIGTAYLWSNVTFTPLYARLSDAIGRRTAYLQAVLLFTVGTLGCGLAPSFGALVVARFVAGMGGGGAGTVASIVLSETFVEDRGFYQGLGFAVFGAGIGLGGPIGGWLTQAWGWRAAFYAQVPVAILCIVLARLTIPQDSEKKYSAETLAEIDLGGSATLLLSIGSLLLLLQRSSADIPLRHDAVGLAALVASIGFFVAFIVVETRIAKRPVLPLSLLKQRTALCVGIIAGVIAIVNFNMLYHLP
ncbi:unnamed protein product [Cutaneotrichosporon oleaginosum]